MPKTAFMFTTYSKHLAVCFGAFSDDVEAQIMTDLGASDPEKIDVASGPPLNLARHPDGQTFLARAATRGIPLGTANTILKDYFIGVKTGDAALKAKAGQDAGKALAEIGALATSRGEASGTGGTHFWSGTKEIAEEEAKGSGGATLEMSGGFLFDNLSFGQEWSQLGSLWDGISAHLARGCTGLVRAHQYRGVRETSVFNRQEWPELRDLLRDGVVTRVDFVRYLKEKGADGRPIWGDPAKKRNPKLKPVNTIPITAEAQKAALEHWDYPESDPDTVGLAP